MTTFKTSIFAGLLAATAITTLPGTAAANDPEGWFRWFPDWQQRDFAPEEITRIVSSLYGPEVFYSTSLLEMNGDTSPEIFLFFDRSCESLVEFPRIEKSVITCPYTVLSQTSENFWEPVFEGSGYRVWHAINNEGVPAGFVIDGAFWAMQDGVVRPIGGIPLEFTSPANFVDLPEIFRGTNNARRLEVAAIETETVKGWLAMEPQQGGESRWRYANSRGEIMASGTVDRSRFDIMVIESDLGGIDIITEADGGLTTQRISVGLTEAEWVEIIDQPELPPGWMTVDLTAAEIADGDPNALFDDIDIIEGGRPDTQSIRWTTVDLPDGSGTLRMSMLVGEWCGMGTCPLRWSLANAEGDIIADMPEDLSYDMICLDDSSYFFRPEDRSLRTCGATITLDTVRRR